MTKYMLILISSTSMIAGWSEDKIVSLLPQLQLCYCLIFRNVLDTRFHLSEHKTEENRRYEIISPGAKKESRCEQGVFCPACFLIIVGTS